MAWRWAAVVVAAAAATAIATAHELNVKWDQVLLLQYDDEEENDNDYDNDNDMYCVCCVAVKQWIFSKTVNRGALSFAMFSASHIGCACVLLGHCSSSLLSFSLVLSLSLYLFLPSIWYGLHLQIYVNLRHVVLSADYYLPLGLHACSPFTPLFFLKKRNITLLRLFNIVV